MVKCRSSMSERKLHFDPYYLASLEAHQLRAKLDGNEENIGSLNKHMLRELYGVEEEVSETLQTLSSGFYRLLEHELQLDAAGEDTQLVRVTQVRWLERFHQLIQLHTSLTYDSQQVALYEASYHWMAKHNAVYSATAVTQRKIMALMLGQNPKDLTLAFEYRAQALELIQNSIKHEDKVVEWDTVQHLLSFYYQELLRVIEASSQDRK